MRAHRTSWQTLVLCFVIGAVVGGGIALIAHMTGSSLLGSPWSVPIILVILAAVVFALAWNVHKYAIGTLKDLDPRRAVNTLVLAKSMTIAGSVLFGWYAGQIIGIYVFGMSEAHYYSSILIQCVVSGGAALVDMVIGIIGEWLCQLPPTEGPEHPDMKRRKQQTPAN